MKDDPRLGLPSASSFGADVACPGRQNLLRSMREQGLPAADDPGLRDLAERGQRLHRARATGDTMPLQEGEFDAYQKACLLEDTLTGQWREDTGVGGYSGGYELLEQRLWLHNPLTLAPMLSGQVDIAKVALNHALVVDWKSSYAYYVPPANRSWQLRVYAVLVWRENEGVTRVRVAYVMPERFGQKLDYCDLNLFDLQRIEQEIFQVLWRSQQPDSQLNAGPHCRFCEARGMCPAAARMATLPAVTTNGDPFALVSAMRAEDLAVVFKRRGQVNAIFDAITERLSALSGEELSAIGLKRTAGKKLDKIKDVAGAYAWFSSKGVSDEDLFAAMSFSKEKLVKLIAGIWGNAYNEAAAKLWDKELDEFIERGRAKPSIVEK